METAEAYLPTLEGARAAGLELPGAEPVERHALAALVVRATVMRREQWDEEWAIPTARAEQLPTDDPAPREDLGPADHVTLVERLREMACRDRRPACTVCAGTGHASIVRVRHHHDRIAVMSEVYIPSYMGQVPGMLTFETALESSIAETPPECLRCLDLRPQQARSAYRGGGAPREPDFLGHRFGDSVERAAAAVQSFARRGAILRSDVRAWAWPFLWLRYGEIAPVPEVVLFVGADAVTHAFVARAPSPAA